MVSTRKKIVISVLVLLALAILFGYNKAKKLIAIFDKMTIEPDDISEFDFNWQKITFKIDVLLTNPTADSFDVSGYGLAKLKKLNVFYKNVFLASTNNFVITDISIPANDKLIIHKIPIEVPPKFLLENPALVTDLIENFDVNDFTTTAVLDILGNEISI